MTEQLSQSEILIKLGTPLALFVVLAFLQNVINAKRKNRSKQALIPFLTIAYQIAATILVVKYIDRIVTALSGVASKLIMQFTGSDNILDLIPLAMLINVVAYAAYIVIKIIGCVVSAIVFRDFRLDALTSKFYEYDEETGEWFILESRTNLRSLFGWLACAATAASGLLVGLLWLAGTDAKSYACVLPVFASMLVVEIYSFLNGYTKEEFMHTVMGDESVSSKISNFYRIREIFEKLFPRNLLTSGTEYEFSGAQSPKNVLEAMKESGDTIEEITSKFFSTNENEEPYDSDCIEATLRLMKGENVIFLNPFYRDLSRYIALPIMNTLLSGKKCLVLIGRYSTREDIKEWLSDLLYDYAKIRSLWRVEELSDKTPDCEVGLLCYSQLYDLRIMGTNADFFKEVGFCLLTEPSLVVNTGQVGLSILTGNMTNNGETPIYCICDRLADGLVDTMSHLFREEITHVVAPPVSRNLHTYMAWDADGDYLGQKLFGKQTQYLGNGMELAAVAVKNQIPKVSWFGESTVPVRDIKWIAGQYYPVICKYMNVPIQQQSIYDKIKFISNIWSVKDESEQFLIAEDEFNNVFATMRTFLSRGRLQTFVNVLSGNYMLRDYMRYNRQIFNTNPNAVPSLVPDYAKTERNTLYKLLLNMSYRCVTETEIRNELNLVGIEIDDEDENNTATEDTIKCLDNLRRKYTYAPEEIFKPESEDDYSEEMYGEESVFTITPEVFDRFFGNDLKTAYYIVEEEESKEEYIDAKLMGHVTQTVLPGQFLTYDGKYYMVKHVSRRNGVVLRRASKLFDGRKYYRQIRHYHLGEKALRSLTSSRTVMDIELERFMADFDVNTSGYLEMNSYNDLRSARIIDFTKDPSVENYSREYRNKSLLRITLPESNDKICYTICLLLQELFRTVFPDACDYIAVVTQKPEEIEGVLNYAVYDFKDETANEDGKSYIYILEDSMVDLGLLDMVSKNLISFMEIITDYLYWHFEKMREPAASDPEVFTREFPKVDVKKQSMLTKFRQRIRKLFGIKSGEEEKTGTGASPVPTAWNSSAPVTPEVSKAGAVPESPAVPAAPKAGAVPESPAVPAAPKAGAVPESSAVPAAPKAGATPESPAEPVTAPTTPLTGNLATAPEGFVPSSAEPVIKDTTGLTGKELRKAKKANKKAIRKAKAEEKKRAKEAAKLHKEEVKRIRKTLNKEQRKEFDKAEKERTKLSRAKAKEEKKLAKEKAKEEKKLNRAKAKEARKSRKKNSNASFVSTLHDGPAGDADKFTSNSKKSGEEAKAGADKAAGALTPESEAAGTKAPEPGAVRTKAAASEPLDDGIEYVVREGITGDNAEIVDIDGTDIFDETDSGDVDMELDDQFREMGIIPTEKTRYQAECYLKFGFDEIDNRLKLDEIRKYLTLRGFSNNSFTKARKRDDFKDGETELESVNCCDFCGAPLSGVSFERLTDGRIRCNDCSASAIRSVEAFKKLFFECKNMMESFYNIEYKKPIIVRTMDAKKIAKGFGSVFTPSTDFAARVVGYAQKKSDRFYLNVENGSPRLAAILTTVHEMTHIWQYVNWDIKEIKKTYPDKQERDMVYEGMAMWASIQYMYLIGEESYAKQQELMALRREDIYGVGFMMFCRRYPLIKDSALVIDSPFKEFPPL